MEFSDDECDDRKSTMLQLVFSPSRQPVRFWSEIRHRTEHVAIMYATSWPPRPAWTHSSIMTMTFVMLAAMTTAVVVPIRIRSRNIAAQRGTRAAAQRSADQAAAGTAHGIACGCARTAAQRAADDSARAFATIRRDRTARSTTHCAAEHRARAASYGAAQRGPGYSAERTA